jgi:hypothetical protein
MPQSEMSLKFNMGRDNSVERESLPPTKGKTSDRIIRKPIATKATQQVGSSIGLQDVGDWTFWKVRPPPERKKEQKTAGVPESLEPLLHSETLID